MKRLWYVELTSDVGEIGTLVKTGDAIAAEHCARIKVKRLVACDPGLGPVGAHEWQTTVTAW